MFAGIDGGGTRARIVLVDGAGNEVARCEGPPGIVDAADPVAAADVAAQLVHAAVGEAGVSLPLDGLCCGLAGAGRNPERDAVSEALSGACVARRVLVVGDAEAAMADAFGDAPGVLVISGTGSIAWARNGDGGCIRVGGWGRHIGDEGSGYRMGVDAVRAVLRAFDWREGATSLTEPLLAATRCSTPDDLVRFSATASKADFAALAPVVLNAADSGDAAAARIRGDAVAALVELAATAVARIRLESAGIALAGGLIDANGPLHRPLRAALRVALPDAAVRDGTVDAARGAAWLVRRTTP